MPRRLPLILPTAALHMLGYLKYVKIIIILYRWNNMVLESLGELNSIIAARIRALAAPFTAERALNDALNKKNHFYI